MNIKNTIHALALPPVLAGAALFAPTHPVQAGEVDANRIVIIVDEEDCNNCVAIGTKEYCTCEIIVVVVYS